MPCIFPRIIGGLVSALPLCLMLAGCGGSGGPSGGSGSALAGTTERKAFICALPSTASLPEAAMQARLVEEGKKLPPSPPPLPPLRLVPLRDGYLEGQPYWENGPTRMGANGQKKAGVACGIMDESWHVHSHLTIFLDGQQIAVPASIGITKPIYQYKDEWPDSFISSSEAGGCYYPLHVHDRSGKIHLEGPHAFEFTLGKLFTLWGQPLSKTQVAGIRRSDIKFYWRNGDGAALALWNKPPASLPLGRHVEITIVIGQPPSSIPTYDYWGQD